MFGCGASPAGRGGLRFKFGGLQVKLGTFLTIVVLAVAGGQVSAPRAQGVAPANAANLNISPKRITFDRSHRSGTVFIFNQGTGPGTFDISLVDRVMLPNGRIISVEEAQADPETKAVADRVEDAEILGDHYSDRSYKITIGKTLVSRALQKAVERAAGHHHE